MRSFGREASAAQNAAKKRGRYGRLIRVPSIQVRAVAGSRKSTRIGTSSSLVMSHPVSHGLSRMGDMRLSGFGSGWRMSAESDVEESFRGSLTNDQWPARPGQAKLASARRGLYQATTIGQLRVSSW